MADVHGKVADVQTTVSYDSGKLGRRFLELGAVALVAGGILIYLQPNEFGEWAMVVVALVVGAASTLYGFLRWKSPQPMLALSPAGLRLHIDFVKTVLIPWPAIHGVDTIDISGRVAGKAAFLPDVTVVLVTRAFYDRHIHVNSWLLRGPGWDTSFIPKGDMVQVALQHEALPATAAELRAAVEARWHAFSNTKPSVGSVDA
ncbi:MAG: hypothetical protein AB7I42_23630 [Bradyrhizobium sp.]|uniref:hypothetical protein n=1 Tax=Bradyrhizobium sp. TaxID=376 RepID=UPI003D0E0A4D